MAEALPGMAVHRDRHQRWVVTYGPHRKVYRRKRSMRRFILKANALGRWPR